MGVSAQDVKALREKTGAALMDCKRALVEAKGDAEKAVILLREKGLAKAQKKRSRATGEGIIASYVHHDSKKGVLVEVACETDFVARNKEFTDLVKEICMQITARNPLAVRREDLPPDVLEAEKQIYARQCEGKPERVVETIIEGKLDKFCKRVCLVEQPYIRDDSKTIKELIDETIGKLGENIEVRRFVRMTVGEDAQE
jgi:elongation factor Ts